MNAISSLVLLGWAMCLENTAKTFDPVLPETTFYRPDISSSSKYSLLTSKPEVPNKSTSLQSPVAFGEGNFYKLLHPSMTRLTDYFNSHSSEFSNWYLSPSLIMSKDLKEQITSGLYKAQPQGDKELKEFWGSIMGELLIRDLPELKSNLAELKEIQNEERKKKSIAELKDINNRKIKEEDSFFGAAWFILDCLSLGVSNRNAESYTDVIGPFVDAAVAFKALEHNFSNIIGSSRSLSSSSASKV
ncbi:hypothetical protein EHEL_050660 [Encephalitozoon hellem ATCC 50504]|uniref:Uncharacterized protein n=1 Tax=Encephalitozoon hellem TaxID=27973 RepID=A0A9Q9C410_ENCHE|nr:uncharacterized protein EHEL_050660 [Encephalitozoon hellem ATCC 50504]AFM98277.1 hypothetical protein EHEL_050660 [Encephalitozoon hellem ATCC 50504]UTX43155.1 hypothetical protein GPU96_05g08940 [Encephalitozoon hellem]WEL38612.1 hypothetical protein PFJ87_05g00800 [Encephalitozoon hellem]|eukprot:XP_003887258.1 hypothetical protein EHEL_050660 [Encephalitozoon hellem ATCC 50504]